MAFSRDLGRIGPLEYSRSVLDPAPGQGRTPVVATVRGTVRTQPLALQMAVADGLQRTTQRVISIQLTLPDDLRLDQCCLSFGPNASSGPSSLLGSDFDVTVRDGEDGAVNMQEVSSLHPPPQQAPPARPSSPGCKALCKKASGAPACRRSGPSVTWVADAQQTQAYVAAIRDAQETQRYGLSMHETEAAIEASASIVQVPSGDESQEPQSLDFAGKQTFAYQLGPSEDNPSVSSQLGPSEDNPSEDNPSVSGSDRLAKRPRQS